MVRNVRWLYSKLGTEDFSGTGQSTITGALSTLQSGLDGKSPMSHTHTTMTLPVSSNQVNSESYVPTSALLYSMIQRANTIADNVTAANEIINGGGSSEPSIDTTDPNTRYESKNLGTWSSTSDVDTFMATYNHANNYTGLSLGNYVTIQDGTYNKQWVIAGFDMESNHTAASGKVYDNGYGICMIPKTIVTNGRWYDDSDVCSTDGGYISSYMHTTVLPTVVTNLKTVLDSHIVNRKVLLSSDIGNYDTGSNAYTWTTAYATLMSAGQMTGTFASDNNKYDDGEANYKLPLFNYEDYWTGGIFWTRNVYDSYLAYIVDINGRVTSDHHGVNDPTDYGVRPLIYLR